MDTSIEEIVERYVKLVLAVDRHFPGYIDAYFGQNDWRTLVAEQSPKPLSELELEVDDLISSLDHLNEIDLQRKDFIAHQLKSVKTVLAVLQEKGLPLVQEAEGYFDYIPHWVNEESFLEAQRVLSDILPSGGSLSERMLERNKKLVISVDQARLLIDKAVKEFRKRAKQRFPIPENDSFEIQFVQNEPWGAYNWFLGKSHSRIDINVDLPLQYNRLIDLMAHEGYPGHHTELSIKEKLLLNERGWLEHSLILINSPVNLVSEGIATNALQTLLPLGELVDWEENELFPQIGLKGINARNEALVDEAERKLSGVSTNAVFLIHDKRVGDDKVIDYLQKYGLRSMQEAQQTVDFIKNPLFRSYMFTYHFGYELLNSLFEKYPKSDCDKLFTKLLSEPATPTQIRSW